MPSSEGPAGSQTTAGFSVLPDLPCKGSRLRRIKYLEKKIKVFISARPKVKSREIKQNKGRGEDEQRGWSRRMWAER